MMKETSYELLKDNQKKQLGKNNKAKMTLYNALPCEEYERVFMCKTAKEVWHTLIITHQGNSQVKNCKIDLLTEEYEKSGLLEQESCEKVSSCSTIEMESQVMVLLLNPSKFFMPIALKATVIRGQTSNDSVCQDGSDEDKDEEEEFNSIVKKLWKLFKNGNRFERENHFGNDGDRFDHGNRSKGVGSSRGKRNCYGCSSKNHFVDDCPKEKMKKAFLVKLGVIAKMVIK
ncbi:UBN2 domain-containing protein [Tanacetum coccineum]